MPVYNINEDELVHIKQVPFKNEKEMQKLLEKHIEKIFNLTFVESEFELDGLRIDTLAFNEETKSFVIIEYKNTKSYSVIDQGYSYLSLLLTRKADFIMLYNEVFDTNKKKEDFDFSQTKVMFIAPTFTNHQERAIQFKDIVFELWKITRYADGNISINKLLTKKHNPSIKEISNTDSVKEKVNSEIKNYSEENLFKDTTDDLVQVYYNFKDEILSEFEEVEIEPRQKYLKFIANNQFIATLSFQKSHMNFRLKTDELDDPDGLTNPLSYEHGGKGSGKFLIKIDSEKDFDYIKKLFEQVYNETI